jgi:hypothetical protein
MILSLFDDCNKTEITKDVTAAACLWMNEKGFKPVETEVAVCFGWVADVAGVLSPTQTELIDLRLLRRRPNWRTPEYEEWKNELAAKHILMTGLVEVKTSMSDFRSDKKWELPSPTNLSYLAIPHDLQIPAEKLPAGWGLLIYKNESIRCTRPPDIRTVTTEQHLSVILEIAVRRDHQTRYEHLRRCQREAREYRNQGQSLTRVRDALRAALSVARGEHGSIAGALQYHGIRNSENIYVRDLECLWGIAAVKTET